MTSYIYSPDCPLKSLVYAAFERIADESLGAIDINQTRLLIDPVTLEQIREMPEINLHNRGCERCGQFPARFPAFLYGIKICIDSPPRFCLHVRGGRIHSRAAQWFALVGRHADASVMVDLFEACRELGFATLLEQGA